MRNLALADITGDDVAAMLSENETLFVEHKGNIDAEAFQIARAMCSFANTLGGWVLVGVTSGRPNAGDPNGWNPVAAAELTDRVRQALQVNRVDPIPAFAATVRDFGDPPQPVGIVRVYESDDAPHVMGNGQVFVRSVAADQQRARVYRPGGVETQAVLVGLAERGRRARADALARFELGRTPFLQGALAFRLSYGLGGIPPGAIALRAVPLTGDRLTGRAVSSAAREAVDRAARFLAGLTDSAAVEQVVSVVGLAARANGDLSLWRHSELRPAKPTTMVGGVGVIQPFDASELLIGEVSVAVDGGGVIGASLLWGESEPPRQPAPLTLDGLRDAVIVPLLAAVCEVLAAGDLFGRSLLELQVASLAQVAEIDEPGGRRPVTGVTVGGIISLPLSDDSAALHEVANQWRGDIGRAVGLAVLR